VGVGPVPIWIPALIIGVLAVLWFTNDLDGPLSQRGLPSLTHACVAENSLGDVVRCALYKGENASTQSSNLPEASPQPQQSTENVQPQQAQPPADTGTTGGGSSTDSAVGAAPSLC